MSDANHPAVPEVTARDNSGMEACPICQRMFASVHLRTIPGGRFRRSPKRICCLCEADLKAKRDVKSAKSGLRGTSGFSKAVFIALMFFVGYAICYLWNPGHVFRKPAAPITGLEGVAGATVDAKARTIRLDMQSDLLFDFGSSAQKTAASDSMQKIAGVIRRYPTAKVLIQGHTDSVGSELANMELATKRAESVREWLVREAGIPESRLAVEGVGSKSPVAPNTNPDGSDNPVGRQQNRRVTLTLSGVELTEPPAEGVFGQIWRVLRWSW